MSDRTPWFEAYEAAAKPPETQTFRVNSEADRAFDAWFEQRLRLDGEIDYE